MPTFEELQAQIQTLDVVDTFGTKKELKYLPDILADTEDVLALTSGFMHGHTWLIVCTDKRVIFLDKGMFYGLQQRETPLERVNSIEQQTGLISGTIGIGDGAEMMQLKEVPKKTVRPFVEVVNKAREALKAGTVAPQLSPNFVNVEGAGAGTGSDQQPSPAPKTLDIVSQLERLADLRDRGVLTDDEFQNQKNKIL